MNNPAGNTVGCEAVNKHICSPVPERLWHYTTFAGFHGIFTSKKIWATDYRFLNDREEFRHAKQLAIELIPEQPALTGHFFPSREYLQKGVEIAFNTGPLHESRLRIMVASFSEERDQLSQWRGYAGNSTGVSVGLDLRGLRPPVEAHTTVTFAPCIYSDSQKRAILRAVFAHYLDGIQNWWESIFAEFLKSVPVGSRGDPSLAQGLVMQNAKELGEVIQRCQSQLLFDFMRVAPLLKNASFSEEKEWRLVLPSEAVMLPTKHPVEFRPVRDALVPYIAYPLLRPNQDGPIPCHDLILGPGSHPSAEVGINLLFQSEFVPIRARHSNIPYRPT